MSGDSHPNELNFIYRPTDRRRRDLGRHPYEIEEMVCAVSLRIHCKETTRAVLRQGHGAIPFAEERLSSPLPANFRNITDLNDRTASLCLEYGNN